MESPLAFLAIFSLLLLASVEARKYPEEDWSNGLATSREEQPVVVESVESADQKQPMELGVIQEEEFYYPIEANQADSTVNDQTSTLSIAINEHNCEKAKDSQAAEVGDTEEEERTINLSPFLVGKPLGNIYKEAIDSADFGEGGLVENKFSFVFNPRTDATIYHE